MKSRDGGLPVALGVLSPYALVLTVLFSLMSSGQSVEAEAPELIATIFCDTAGTLFGAKIVRIGDSNNDGYDDILVGDGRPAVYLFYGGDPADTVPALKFERVSGLYGGFGDLSGDGYDDFVISGRDPYAWKLGLYYGGPDVDTVRDLWFGRDGTSPFWPIAHGMDYDNDGDTELVSYHSEHKSVFFYELGSDSDSLEDFILTPANWPADTAEGFTFGRGIIIGDFNGDGDNDLAVSFGRPSQCLENGKVFLYWGGPEFDTIPDMIIRRPGPDIPGFNKMGDVVEFLGDINGDGFDDFYAGTGNSADSLGFIHFGGPDIDTIPDIIIYDRSHLAALAGDLNGDGYGDLILGYDFPYHSNGYAKIYFGGPDMDGVADHAVYVWDLPANHNYFGMGATGVGDFNGDGVNDFAVSAEYRGLSHWRHGVVYIFSGWEDPTDVEYEHEPVLPDDPQLMQVYPNPFNMETTIEFSLARADHVTLEAFNLLGQPVATLIDKNLAFGTYRVSWDGKNSNGATLASGVYYVKLQKGEQTTTNKVILLK